MDKIAEDFGISLIKLNEFLIKYNAIIAGSSALKAFIFSQKSEQFYNILRIKEDITQFLNVIEVKCENSEIKKLIHSDPNSLEIVQFFNKHFFY